MLLEHSRSGWPLVIGGDVKIAYGLMLLAQFRSAISREES